MRSLLAVAMAVALCAGVWAQDEAVEEAEAVEETVETKRVLGLQIPADWDGRMELGYSATRGNSRSDDLRFVARARRETERRRASLSLTFDWASSREGTTEQRLTLRGLHDWLVPGEKYFYFAEGRYDWDRFEDWDSRFSGRVGLGYDFVRTDELTLTGRTGLGATEGTGDGRSWDAEGSVGGEGRWRPREGMELGANSTYYAALNNTRFADPWRVISEAYCEMQMAAFEQVSVRLFVEHEYRSRVAESFKKNDTRWGATVVYSF